MNISEIYKYVNKLIETYETNDPFILAEYLGIKVIRKKLGRLKGFFTVILRNNYIIINEDLDDISAKIICAHEIAHYLFHRGLGINIFRDYRCVSLKPSTTEIEANYFAAEYLISDERFLALAAEGYTYAQIASALNVNKELAAIKAHLLSSRGHKLNLPYKPQANFLAKI